MVKVQDFLRILDGQGAVLYVEDSQEGRHFMGYYSLEDGEQDGDGACHDWLKSLTVRAFNIGNSLLVAKSPYTFDETEYLLKGEKGEYKSEDWSHKAQEDGKMSFRERKAQLDGGKDF